MCFTVHSGFVYDDRLWARPWTPLRTRLHLCRVGRPARDLRRTVPADTKHHARPGSRDLRPELLRVPRHEHGPARSVDVPALRSVEPLESSPWARVSGALDPRGPPDGRLEHRVDQRTHRHPCRHLHPGDAHRVPRTERHTNPAGAGCEPARALEQGNRGHAARDRHPVRHGGPRSRKQKARYATLRALIAFVVLYVAVWVSLFPEKTMGRLQATAATLQSEQSGWTALFGSLFSQLFHPIGFETWRATRDSLPLSLWVAFSVALGVATLGVSFVDSARALPWRLVALGSRLLGARRLPLPRPRRGRRLPARQTAHDRVRHRGRRVRRSHRRIIPMAIRGARRPDPPPLRTRSERDLGRVGISGLPVPNGPALQAGEPAFLGGLTPGMKQDLERERRFEAHRDDPLETPFEP